MVKNVVFDLGGVLIDWNPRYLYRKIFSSEQQMEDFLARICTQEWNEQQDAGRSFVTAVNERVALFPEFHQEIESYDQRWAEMLNGPIQGTVDILQTVKAAGKHRVLGLSNWSQEKFPLAEKNYPFLKLFEDIVVSGRIRIKKPDPAIFRYLCEQHGILPAESVFIDDSKVNIEAATALGFQTVHFKSPEQLKACLLEMQIL